MFDQAGRAATSSRAGGGFHQGCALLQAGRHLRDGVSSDAARSTSRAGVAVVLHYGGQHGDVVALGSYYYILVDHDILGFGHLRMRQMLFWKESRIRGQLKPKSMEEKIHFFNT